MAYREAVRSVLTAYSNHAPAIGYVQGMNMSVSAILFNICSSFERAAVYQEDAFKLFVAIMERTQVGEYYKGNMEGIKGIINELKERIQADLPEVYWHFLQTDVPSSGKRADVLRQLLLRLRPPHHPARVLRVRPEPGPPLSAHQTAPTPSTSSSSSSSDATGPRSSPRTRTRLWLWCPRWCWKGP